MPARKISRTVLSQDSVSAADFLAPVSQELRQVQDRLGQCLVTPYDSMNQQIQAIGAGQGKMFRPAFMLLTGLACGGIRPQHIELAVIIEMVHTATLLHDDVIDRASRRRNNPTVNRLYGNTAAVLLGDFLLSRAFEAGVELNIPQAQKVLTRTAQQICQGELLQNIRRADWTMSRDEYLEIIEAKTAGLFSAACRLGAYTGGADAAAVENFAEYGRCVGMAFQITDDILDITGEVDKIGKTLGTDVAQKKPTLSLIHYLEHQSPERKKTFLEKISGRLDTGQLVKILADGGSLDFARKTAGQFVKKAVDAIRAYPACPGVESMKKMAKAIGKRA